MADTLTTNLKLTNQTEGGNDNTWGIKVDDNFERLDAILGNTTEITTTGGATSLTDEQELVANILVNGTLVSNATVNFSGRGGRWVVANDTTGDFTLTVKVTGETGVAIPQGTAQVVWCDGDDIRLGNTSPEAAGEVTVASAATTEILGAGSDLVAISGTATITSFGTGASVKRFCRATGTFTITHNATSLICPGGSNIKAAAGDTFIVVSDESSNARILMYQRAGVPPSYLPIGFVGNYAGDTAPAFWLLCFGQAVSRTTYAALFDVIGITYGSGDNVSTFNLPDLRGRVVAGKDDMGGTSANRLTNQTGGLNGDTLGATGGSEAHTLTEGQMPSHDHDYSGTTSTDGFHGHPIRRKHGGDDASGSGGLLLRNSAGERENVTFTGTTPTDTFGEQLGGAGDHDHTYSGTTTSAGSGQAHNNVQPTLILNKIIFAGV